MLWARKISLHRAPISPSQSSKSPSQIRQTSYLYEPMFSTLPGPTTIHWLRASFSSEWNARVLLFHVWSASFSDTDHLNVHWCMYHSMLPMEGSSVWMAPAPIFYGSSNPFSMLVNVMYILGFISIEKKRSLWYCIKRHRWYLVKEPVIHERFSTGCSNFTIVSSRSGKKIIILYGDGCRQIGILF